MTKAFIGYGELGKQIHAFVCDNELSEEVIFFDDALFAAGISFSFPFDAWSENRFSGFSFFISLGYKHLSLKNELVQQLNKSNRNIFSFVHETCFINPSAQVGSGVAVYPMCNIDKEVVLGHGVLLNNSVVISHNSIIGNCSYLSPAVVISGNVTVGENSFIGSGSVVANNINIGNNVIIGAGSVITKDVPDNSFVIGNPMKFAKKIKLT